MILGKFKFLYGIIIWTPACMPVSPRVGLPNLFMNGLGGLPTETCHCFKAFTALHTCEAHTIFPLLDVFLLAKLLYP